MNPPRKLYFFLFVVSLGGILSIWVSKGGIRVFAQNASPTHLDAMTESGEHKYTNRLIDETSPYLLQHAHNPVDWYPWGNAAFEKARKENKLIFLSVGYSTCHWCHVMERESFENPEIAKVMNENFVNIKVDREERPDVDRVYMTFVQATTGGGGWPMSVWLTPDLKPFVGGTYFPPEDKWGRPGFKTVLSRIARMWQNEREDILANADQLTNALSQFVAPSTGPDDHLAANLREKAYGQVSSSFDEKLGGFGDAPKFPRPVVFNFLYRVYHAAPESENGKRALEMTLVTLRKMAEGGMHDHVGGGFHRYSVDRFWHVPHFEKMLYDQAQLADAYLTAYQITGDRIFETTARDILDYVRRDMTADGAGFYSAEDADSLLEHGKSAHAEGAFYVWTKEEIDTLLGPERAKVFEYRYGVEFGGNVPSDGDPHGEFIGKNILIQRQTLTETSNEFGLDEDIVRQLLDESRRILFEARKKRPRPHLDDKILTAWNGLMISAFARGHQVLGDSDYLDAANNAANFIRAKLYRPDSRTLIRSYREGPGDIGGFADDYAFLIQGLLDLYETSFDVSRLEWAVSLQERQNELFWDEKGGGYFATTGKDPSVLLRMKESHDGAEPSPNSVAALNLQRLANMLDRIEWREMALKTMRAFGSQMEQSPTTLPQMLVALDGHRSTSKQIVIAGKPGAADTQAMLREVHRRFIPNKVLILADGAEGQEFFARRVELMRTISAINGEATAYVCENFVCQLPTTEVQVFIDLLTGKKSVPDR